MSIVSSNQARVPVAVPSRFPQVTMQFETFKTTLCPLAPSEYHDKKICPHYHDHGDRRRFPIIYKPQKCDDFFDGHGNGCQFGDECDKCHSRIELLYHPEVFKRRFCATYPANILDCNRGNFCAFAHARNEILAPLCREIDEQCGSHLFRMEAYKTLWCPYGVPHDWHRCVYAHTYQDFRRTPLLGYGLEPCPYWRHDDKDKEYVERCPYGFRCPYSHGSKEQLYHPMHFKVSPCSDFKRTQVCPRAQQCAFFHDDHLDRRDPNTHVLPGYPDFTKVEYTKPLDEEWVVQVFSNHQPHFGRPPAFSVNEFPRIVGDASNPYIDLSVPFRPRHARKRY